MVPPYLNATARALISEAGKPCRSCVHGVVLVGMTHTITAHSGFS
jgi:hypothetical protein